MQQALKERIHQMQRNEITEHRIYARLAEGLKNTENGPILETIGKDELRHYEFLKGFTERDAQPKRFKMFFFVVIARILGVTFALKLLERGEEGAQELYRDMSDEVPDVIEIIADEDEHEEKLLSMLKEERLEYVGSIVLGLNDALVELTGALAGLSFALQNTRLIAVAGLITGIAASLSMAASEYLSNRSDGRNEKAVKSAVYTGIAYIITVALLILPYLIFSHYMVCLAATLGIAILIIFFFNYYVAVAKDLQFWPRFLEMASLSLGVAGISFAIGILVRSTIGIDI